MQITVIPTDEGNILRNAATQLRARYPKAAAQLKFMAAQADTRIARERFLLQQREDTRGRWVRRTQSNTGPGVPGLGHIAVTYRYTSLRSSEALCGKVLVGELDWDVRADPNDLAPDSWCACRVCFNAVKALAAQLPAGWLLQEPANTGGEAAAS